MTAQAAAADLPLVGVRVLEAGGSMAVGYAGRLLCDLGADVVKLEPRDGDPWRSVGPRSAGRSDVDRAAAAYFHHGKRSVVAETTAVEGQQSISALLGATDIVVHDLDADRWFAHGALDAARAVRPALIVVDTSTFGSSGPFAHSPGGDLVATALSGMLSIVSTGASDPEAMPLRLPGELSSMFAACNAALVAVAALVACDRDGVGARIEVSALECIASTLATAYGSVTYAGNVPAHDGTRGVVPWAIYTCIDGEVLVQCTEDSQWRSLVKILGDPEWGHLDMFETTALRIEHVDSVEALVAGAMFDQTVAAFLDAAQHEGVAATLVHSADDVVNWEHLRARGFFQPIEVPDRAASDGGAVRVLAPTPPYRFDGQPLAGPRRLAAAGQHSAEVLHDWQPRSTASGATTPGATTAAAPRRPLEGVRVLDLTWVWAGPFSAMQLAHLGAEVIKIESSGRMDVTRILGPMADNEPGPNRSAYFNQFNQGKQSVCLDLSTQAGRDVLTRLVATADLIVDNMRAGALARMGFDDAHLHRLNPRIVAVSLTGFGESGPARDRQAYGSIIDALSGVNSIVGRPGEGPTEVPMSLPDPGSGLHAAVAMVAALRRSRRSGVGCRLEVSMLEAWISTVPWTVLGRGPDGELPQAMGNRDMAVVPHGVFPCAGTYQWVAVLTEDHDRFRRLATLIGRPDLGDDASLRSVDARRAREAELEAAITAWTGQHSPDDAVRLLHEAGVTAAPVRRMDEVVECHHLGSRAFAVALDHPEIGPRALPGMPWSSSSWPRHPRSAAPAMGQHTEHVLRELLGMTAADVTELSEAGVLR